MTTPSPLSLLVALALSAALLASACGGEKDGPDPIGDPTPAPVTPAAGAAAPVPDDSRPPDEIVEKALDTLAQDHGLSTEDLEVLAAVTRQYPVSEQTAYGVKAVDSTTGELYTVTLDANGEQADPDQLLANEDAAYHEKYGNLEIDLFNELAEAPPDKLIDIIIRVEEPAYVPPDLPDMTKPLTADQADAYLKLADEERAQSVADTLQPLQAELKALGIEATADRYSPQVSASLTPDQVQKVQDLPGVSLVYLARVYDPMVDVGRQVVRANVVNRLGITGSGVKAAVIEVGGAQTYPPNPYLSSIVNDYASACTSAHSTGVAGIVASTHPTVRGIAPNVSLRLGGSCSGDTSQLKARTDAAVDWGASVINYSFGCYSCLSPNSFAAYVDDLVANRSRTVVIAAGNGGRPGDSLPDGVVSPALAYNAIAVGASDDKGTLDWSDDTIADYSSFGDPVSAGGDREEPDLVAPGTNITSTNNYVSAVGNAGSGTSYAAPIVAGIAALMVQRDPSLAVLPAAVRAILMASAVHNIEGSARLSEKDGVGQVCADCADEVVRKANGASWYATMYSSSWDSSEYFYSLNLTGGRPVRAVLTWNTDPADPYYSSQPSGDLALIIVDEENRYWAADTFDNNFEIVSFTPPESGLYRFKVWEREWTTGQQQMALAVFQGDPAPYATPAPTDTPPPTATPTPTPRPAATPTRTPTTGPSPTPKTPTPTKRPTKIAEYR